MKIFFQRLQAISLSQILGTVMLVAIIIALPVFLVVSQKQQEIRQQASTTAIPSQVCGSQPADIMLIIDKSGSMASSLGNTSTTKLAAAKTAAANFITIISANTQNHAGLTTFQTTAALNAKLTNNISSINSQISQITAGGSTCTACGAKTADDEIHLDGRTGFKKVAILLTDGIANIIPGSASQVSTTSAEAAAITEIQNEYTRDGTIYFTIGLGNKNGNLQTGIDEPFLQKIASITGGKYYYSPTTDNLSQIYQNISQILGKGSISGFIFNDVNNNSIFDTADPKLTGWDLNLNVGSPTGQLLLTSTTDSSGGYSFTGLCDGTYFLKQVNQSGWTQTLPVNQQYYSINIVNGNVNTDKNFGDVQRACGTACSNNASCSGATGDCALCNPATLKCGGPTPTATPTPTLQSTITQVPICGKTCTSNVDCQSTGSACMFCDTTATHKCVADITPTATFTPTPTPAPTNTTFAMTILLHGIAHGGDNPNPNSLGNFNPLHPERTITVELYDTNNLLLTNKQGPIVLASASGNFKGTIDMGILSTGDYIVKVKSNLYLRRLVPGVQHIISGQTHILPAIAMITGDVNNDNTLDILDYNLIIGCYSSDPSIFPPKSCTNAQKLTTDLTDDGKVDGDDYNQFLRELSVQNGD